MMWYLVLAICLIGYTYFMFYYLPDVSNKRTKSYKKSPSIIKAKSQQKSLKTKKKK